MGRPGGLISRREIIKGTAVGATLLPIAVASTESSAQHHEHDAASSAQPAPAAGHASTEQTTYLFFKSEEAVFIEAAVARLIPKDDQWGGAIEAGVPNYIDKQLGGAWGAGELLYRSGPWQPGTPSQGYQLPFTPAELFRTALRAIDTELSRRPFAKMSPDEQDNYLKALEAGAKDIRC